MEGRFYSFQNLHPLCQVQGGAEILDVNVGHPEIDEKKMMVRVLKAIQSVCDVPLQIDSTKPEVIEAGLRYYNGKPILNSVNGEEQSLATVLPLVKKYGASVVGLALEENGIPKTAEGRFEIAKRIVERAEAVGIDRKDVYIDCLTLTVSAEQAACRQTLEALHREKRNLAVKPVSVYQTFLSDFRTVSLSKELSLQWLWNRDLICRLSTQMLSR